MSQALEPPRIKTLKDGLAKMIPKFPNDKASLTALQQMPLPKLLVVYVNWRMRFVAPVPRTVVVRPQAGPDARWKPLKADIDDLLEKVKRGDDLTPHLSLKVGTRGFTPAAHGPTGGASRWEEKDFVLNTKGFHHFHLGSVIEPAGHIKRSDVVLFAHVTRAAYTVIGLFDHSVFDDANPGLTSERQRLLQQHEEFVFDGLPMGSVVVANPIATSGHSLGCVFQAQHFARIIGRIDPKLDNPQFVESLLYDGTGAKRPKRLKLHWILKHLDLILSDGQTGFILHRGFL